MLANCVSGSLFANLLVNWKPVKSEWGKKCYNSCNFFLSAFSHVLQMLYEGETYLDIPSTHINFIYYSGDIALFYHQI